MNIKYKIKDAEQERDRGLGLREILIPGGLVKRVMSHPDSGKFNDSAPYVALTTVLAQLSMYASAVYTPYKLFELIKDSF